MAQPATFNFVIQPPDSINGEGSRNLLLAADSLVVFGYSYIEGDEHYSSIFFDNSGNELSRNYFNPPFPMYAFRQEACTPTSSGFVVGSEVTQGDGYGWSALMISLDQNMDTLWLSSFDAANSAYTGFYKAKQIGDYYYGAGYVGDEYDGDGYADDNNMMIACFSPDGEMLWYEQVPAYVEYFGSVANDVFKINDEEYILVGRVINAHGFDPYTMVELNNIQFPILVKVNITTDEFQVFPFANLEFTNHLASTVELEEGDLMVCYGKTIGATSQFSAAERPIAEIHIMRFDPSNFIVEYDNVLDTLYPYGLFNDFMRTSDGGFMITGKSSGQYLDDVWGLTNYPKGFFWKLDSLGNEEWFEEYFAPDPTPDDLYDQLYFWDVEECSDGGFAAVGDWYNNGLPSEHLTWLLKTDCKGKLEPPLLSLSAMIQQNGDTLQVNSTGAGVYDFSWDFGNGEVANVDSLTYVFTEPGEYLVIAIGTYCTIDIDTTFIV
ncbi:MAG: hypothetical protein SH856_09665 [Flavobacteriales bacterium]|nr:hypothetical protein [Flavobacteriales bacterium]